MVAFSRVRVPVVGSNVAVPLPHWAEVVFASRVTPFTSTVDAGAAKAATGVAALI